MSAAGVMQTNWKFVETLLQEIKNKVQNMWMYFLNSSIEKNQLIYTVYFICFLLKVWRFCIEVSFYIFHFILHNF